MDEALARLVRERAQECCEYCRLPQAYSVLTFEVDHVIARKHGGPTVPGNLALSCFYCNSAKGPNIADLDPRTGRLTGLFHPRRHRWARHFRWNGPVLVGRTPVGRTTIVVLGINDPEAVAMRQALMDAGLFPPAKGI
jgi:hypothetical protein